MIPRHRPPFGIGTVLSHLLSANVSVPEVESRFAESTGMADAVWFPSARSGIYSVLKATTDSSTRIVAPAYTCAVVHEALVRTGSQIQLIDTDRNSFLMDTMTLMAAQSGKFATVLCEIYGHTYDLHRIASPAGPKPQVRIVDMAMTVPNRALFQRLEDGDVGVLSFGIGKSMYAGWGGMCFTNNRNLGEELRKMRDSFLVMGGPTFFLKQATETVLRTLAHQRAVYGLMRKIKQTKPGKKQGRGPKPAGFPARWAGVKNVSAEWFAPSIYLDRRLALYNLNRVEHYCQRRIAQAARYQKNFEGSALVTSPRLSVHALSHFTIRVNPAIRQGVRERLWKKSIDVGTLFPFPSYLPANDFPNTKNVTSEILNLPLDPGLTFDEIDRISEHVLEAVGSFETKHEPVLLESSHD